MVRGEETYLLQAQLLKPDRAEEEVGHFTDVGCVVKVGNEEDRGVVLQVERGRRRRGVSSRT